MYFLNSQSILAATLLLGSALAAKLKIMPLGDSITEITCWRPIVWDNLVSAGLADKVEFVGSMTNNPQNCAAKATNWDKHHEGHSGYLAINIANTNLPGWLANTKPDIVMFMLGTNDISNNKNTNDIVASYTKMVGQMRAVTPGVKVIIDQIIPLSIGSYSSAVNALNKAIPPWAAAQSTAASPIVVSDCFTGFTTSMLRDGVHPNSQGDALIAQRVTPPLIAFIQQALNGTKV